MTALDEADREFEPRILVFSSNNISDPGIDLAGSSRIHYPHGVVIINVPCTSGIKPAWILYALQRGFDGVCLAADGDECALLTDCAQRTARIVADAQVLLEQHGCSPRRLRMAAICSVCAEQFVRCISQFEQVLAELEPFRVG